MTRKILLGLIVTVMLAAPAMAYHSWWDYHWARTSNPFTLQLGDNLSAEWDPYLVNSSNDWSQSTVLDTVIVPGGTTPSACTPVLGRVEVCNAKYGRNGWLGLAQIWVSWDHIAQGTVQMNDTYFSSGAYKKSTWKNAVMCQEVGHTLGLDHQDEDYNNAPLGSCMDYTDKPEFNQHPNLHDYEQLELIYEHLDETSTVGAAPGSGNSGQVRSGRPSDWGKLVKHNGKTAVFERDLGRGHKVFSFVVYAE